jgi:hypothetical protein
MPRVTAASVSVIVLEFLGPLCWFTRIGWLRRLSFGAFIVFHIYSGVIVGFWYTTLMLPVVVAAFLGFGEPLLAGYQIARRQLATLALFAIALFGGCVHLFIPGDVRLTAEGRFLGLFIFDANHAVQFQAEIEKGGKLWIIRIFRDRQQGGDNGDNGMRCAFYQNDELVRSFPVTGPIRDGGGIIFNPGYFTAARMRIAGDPYLYYFYARANWCGVIAPIACPSGWTKGWTATLNT